MKDFGRSFNNVEGKPTSIAQVRLFKEFTQNGTAIARQDNGIAVTALKFDYDLLTANVTEFRRVPSLRVIEYSNRSGSHVVLI